MIYRGRVRNGTIVLEDEVHLSEGTAVNVEPVETSAAADESQVPTLSERLRNVIGIVDGLPADFAENHDHYIHGAPRK